MMMKLFHKHIEAFGLLNMPSQPDSGLLGVIFFLISKCTNICRIISKFDSVLEQSDYVSQTKTKQKKKIKFFNIVKSK